MLNNIQFFILRDSNLNRDSMQEKSFKKIDEKLVEHVSKLARLELTKEEIEKFSREMEEILDAFKNIDEVNTEKVEPSFHPQKIKNVWREDKPEDWRWNPLENSRQKENKYFKGPRIV